MKTTLCFLLLFFIAQLHQCFAVPQPGDITNTVQTNKEQQAISIGPFIVGGDGKNKQSEQVSCELNTWLVPIAQIIVWPVVIVFVVLWFDKEIRRFLGNVKSIKGRDISLEMSAGPADLQKQGSGSPVTPISAGETSGEFEKARAGVKITPALEVIAQRVRDELKKTKFTPEQQIELGVLAIARVVLIAEFWRVYNFIFGTQLELLQQINTRQFTEADLQTFFASVQIRFPDVYKGSNHKVYVNFLLSNGLLEEHAGNYLISHKGKEFLVWCIETNLSLNKPF